MWRTMILSFKQIGRNKIRSFLTILGIIIGVASVIVLINIIEGVKLQMIESYEKIGINTIEVNTYRKSDAFTLEELDQILADNPGRFAGYSPIVDIENVHMETETDAFVVHVRGTGSNFADLRNLALGTGSNFADLRNLALEDGKFYSYPAVQNGEQYCVLGHLLRSRMFGTEDPVGRQINIKGCYYTVIGSLTVSDGDTEGSNDDIIYVPYTAASQIAGSDKLTSVIFSLQGTDAIMEALQSLQTYMEEKTGSADQYSIYSPIEIINNMNDMIASMSAMLLCVAAISLLVGGIGIMNIMYVNVLERTREIGVRAAIGASPAVIMAQFITEAVILSLMGGVTGVFIGTAATFLASEFIAIPLILSARALVLALGVSVSIGILFGIMPARKAAVLDPVMALGAE